MALPEEVAARLLAEAVRQRTSLRAVAARFFASSPNLSYMKPVVRVLTLGVARNFLLLDRVLASLGYGPPSHSTQWMLARVLAYEALSGKLKPSRARAAARKAGVDAVKLLELRNARPEEFVKGLTGKQRLSVLYSVPMWLLEELERANVKGMEELLRMLNTDPTRWIRIRPDVDRRSLLAKLSEKYGIEAVEDPDLPDVARIVSGDSMLAKTEEHSRGLYVIQDKASALVSWVASPRGRIAVDPTAGAAVKASHLAWLGASYVVASDANPARLSEATRTLSRLALNHIVDLVVADARRPHIRGFDAAVVDPPCSDVGRLQHEPEVKMWLTRDDIRMFRGLQYRILRAFLEAAPRSSTIVYSVCTLTYSETFDVISRVMKDVGDVELVDAEPLIGERPRRMPKAQRMLPHIHETQGFFIAKLVKL
jgi:16S rRNA (cytosine967-C5)-methyltransferase